VTQQELAPSDKLVVLTSDGVTGVLPDDDMLGVAMRALEQVRLAAAGGMGEGGSSQGVVMPGCCVGQQLLLRAAEWVYITSWSALLQVVRLC
jgi:hypothetical protein